jgi:outer membrane protein assembly factor BamB
MSSFVSALRRCAWLAGAFCILVLLGLSANAISSRAADPNPPTKIDELVTRLNLDPSNKHLLADLRSQDNWLRTSYFRSVHFAETGEILLLIGIALFLLFAKGADNLSAKPPFPNPAEPARFEGDSLTSFRTVLVLGSALGGVLALVATLSRHDTVAAYVKAEPLPQQTPAAPGPPAPLAQAGTALAVLPPTSSAATTEPAKVGAASPSSSAPMPLGGTLLTPLPVKEPTGSLRESRTVRRANPATTMEPMNLADWPCFRGPAAGLAPGWPGPYDWDVPSGKGVLWKVDLDLPGWNSPIVTGGRVFLSAADDKRREVCAFDLKTGRSLWRLSVPLLAGSSQVKPSPDAGYAPSTMATDGKRVFAAFVNGDVICVSIDGKPQWGRAFGPLENTYGFASSLLCAAGKLLVQVDQASSSDGKSSLFALDPATGISKWQAKRAVSASWSSPIAVKTQGKTVVIVTADPRIAAYDVENGTEIWHADGLSGEIAPTATFGDGRFYIGELGSVLMAASAADGKVVWTSSDAALPDIGSFAYASGLLFFGSSDGTFTAVDGATGKTVWEKKLPKPARSSPIVVGKDVMILCSDGILRTVKADRTYALVRENRLGEPAEATPAFAEGRMILRGEHHLYCVGTK